MSLRWRITLALTLPALVVAVVFGVVAFHYSVDESNQAVSSRLYQAARQLRSPAAQMPRSSSSERLSTSPSALACARLNLEQCPVLSMVVAQHLTGGGAITASYGGVALPVLPRDRQIARSGGGPWLHTVTADGQSYRVVTTAYEGGRGGAVEVGENLALTTHQLNHTKWEFFGIGAVLVLAAFLGGIIASRRLTHPIEELTEFTDDVRSGKEHEPIGAISRNDEIGQLSRSFAELLEELKASRDQQRQLVHDAGHELRTPLTSLRTNIELLNKHGDALPLAARQRILASLNAESQELAHLVEEVLELAGDEYGEEEAVPVRVDEVVGRVVERVRLRTYREVRLATAPWMAVAQERSLVRAVANLLSNAVKFSPANTPIDVLALPGRVVVRDRGPGIAKEDLPRIFGRFYRSPSHQTVPGSGLGLAIVKRFVDANGGHVLASNASGGGALVGFTLQIMNTPTTHPTSEDSTGFGMGVTAQGGVASSGPDESAGAPDPAASAPPRPAAAPPPFGSPGSPGSSIPPPPDGGGSGVNATSNGGNGLGRSHAPPNGVSSRAEGSARGAASDRPPSNDDPIGEQTLANGRDA